MTNKPMDKKLIIGLSITVFGLAMFMGSLQYVPQYGYMAPFTMSLILIGGLAFILHSFGSARAPVVRIERGSSWMSLRRTLS